MPAVPLTGALIGFGQVAEKAHVPAFLSRGDFRLAAVADPLPERREAARRLLPGIRLYADAQELLAREENLDFVDICTPPREHPALARQALTRGLHVLCEKPLTLAPEDFAVLQQAARQADRVLITVHNWKYAPLLARAAELARSGIIGELQRLEWEVWRPAGSGGGLTAWRQEGGQALGGILLDHGWHAFYLAMEWAGSAPTALKARLVFGKGSGGVEQEAEVGLQFPACQGRLFLTWQAAERRNWGRLGGSEGEILLADDYLVAASAHQPPEVQRYPAKLSAGSHHPDWMGGVLDEFLDEIIHRRRRGRNLREAELCARLICLAYRSHQEGSCWVEVEPHEAPG
ncbi:MAG: Gfo/Idh/MocA family oxidoreductase [Deltaproteobacteria bacterium]|nr:Gfo/Idh/MocA family oxidoreductase [Deltaproteobacteria bacterium]